MTVMYRMSLDDEAAEGQEAIADGHQAVIRHWLVINADGVITPMEEREHDRVLEVQAAVIAEQSWRLLFRATWKRWARRLANRGADARTLRDMQRAHRELESLKPRYRITTVPFGVDPFGVMDNAA